MVLQENKAEKALDALRGLSAPHARVLREGREQLIEGTKLVPGDIILLEAGDVVPVSKNSEVSPSPRAAKKETPAEAWGCGPGLFLPPSRISWKNRL